MLTYTPPKPPEPIKPTEKPWLLLLLAFIWLWPGIFGHDPWKPDEPYINAAVQHIITTGNWLFPTASDIPNPEPFPLYYWVAAIFSKIFSPWLLSLHDAARLATPFFLSIALLCIGCTARIIIGKRHGRSAVLMLIGCIGLIVTGHQMSVITALFAGFSMAMLAFTITTTTPGRAGTLLGIAITTIFISGMLTDVITVLLIASILPSSQHWRNKNYLVAIIFAIIISTILISVWLVVFYHAMPKTFENWWLYISQSGLHELKFSRLTQSIPYLLVTLSWLAWPAWPLAGWAIYRGKKNEPVLILSISFVIVYSLILGTSGSLSSEKTIPLLMPIALLAATELDSLRRGASSFLNWFGITTFGFFGMVIWIGWIAMNFGWPAKLAARSAYFSPFYQPTISITAIIFAIIACLVWLWAVTRRHLKGRQAVTNWAAGITLFSCLVYSLWLPWLNAAKSFRPVVNDMQKNMPKELRLTLQTGKSCIATEQNNTTARLAWAYYANIELKTFKHNEPIPCKWRLTSRNKDHPLNTPLWEPIWQGNRPRDKSDNFGLYKHR